MTPEEQYRSWVRRLWLKVANTYRIAARQGMHPVEWLDWNRLVDIDRD